MEREEQEGSFGNEKSYLGREREKGLTWYKAMPEGFATLIGTVVDKKYTYMNKIKGFRLRVHVVNAAECGTRWSYIDVRVLVTGVNSVPFPGKGTLCAVHGRVLFRSFNGRVYVEIILDEKPHAVYQVHMLEGWKEPYTPGENENER